MKYTIKNGDILDVSYQNQSEIQRVVIIHNTAYFQRTDAIGYSSIDYVKKSYKIHKAYRVDSVAKDASLQCYALAVMTGAKPLLSKYDLIYHPAKDLEDKIAVLRGRMLEDGIALKLLMKEI